MKRDESALYRESYFLHGRSFFMRHRGLRLSPRLARAAVYAGVDSRDAVLELGFGRGELAFYCADKGAQYTGIDFSSAAHTIARSVVRQLPPDRRRLVTFRRLDLRHMGSKLPPASLVLMVDVLEHLSPKAGRSLLVAAAQSLLPCGRMVIHTHFGRRVATRRTPALTTAEKRYLAHVGHHCIYTVASLRSVLPGDVVLTRPHPRVALVIKPSPSRSPMEQHDEG